MEEDEDVELEEGDGDLSSVDEELDDEGSLLFSQSEDEASDKEEEEEENNEPYVPPQHESVTKSATTTESSKQRKKTFKEEHEPSETRDQRTLFIGNIPIETAQSRSLQRKLTSFIESFSPYPILTKATALRFRSVAFATPTEHVEDDDADDAAAKKKKKGKSKERSQNYKEAVAAVEGGENAQAPLTAQQKRKIAFINKDFHEKAKSVSAYITIAHPKAVLQHLYDITPPKAKSKTAAGAKTAPVELDSRLTGSVLAALIASFADGQPFEGRHLRVDLVKSISPSEVLSSVSKRSRPLTAPLLALAIPPPTPSRHCSLEVSISKRRRTSSCLLRSSPHRRTWFRRRDRHHPHHRSRWPTRSRSFARFVGTRVPLRSPAQRKVTESVNRDAEWVRSVRLIRDAATQMGKGIGYVKFASQQCVDEIMAIYNAEQAFLESIKGVKGSLGASASIAAGGKEFKRKLKLGGRPIRVAYCKSQTKSSAPQRRGGKNNNGAAGQEGNLTEPTTPQRKSPRSYERSSGAPTPNGTSPHVLGKHPRGLPTKITPGSPTASRTSNPADIAKKAELYATLSKDQRKQMKKDDADRVNRRMEKKNKKFGAPAEERRVGTPISRWLPKGRKLRVRRGSS